MKVIKIFIGAVLISAPTFGMILVSEVTAKTLVVCGPNGAARIVEKVPPGCHVLKANSPPAGKS